MATYRTLGIIAGSGIYPRIWITNARKQNPGIRIVMVAFHNETAAETVAMADVVEHFRVGQVSKPLKFMQAHAVEAVVMAGQLAPSNLFNFRPDLRALFILAKLKERNAETLFGAVADEISAAGIPVLLATTYMQDCMPKAGHVCGAKPHKRLQDDAVFGMRIAKQVSAMDIGQSIVVRQGTVLAVEGFEGTNACIRRGGELGQGKLTTLVKVSKPRQDLRFDVPVIGPSTIENCARSGVQNIVVEANRCIMLEFDTMAKLARELGVCVFAWQEGE